MKRRCATDSVVSSLIAALEVRGSFTLGTNMTHGVTGQVTPH